MRSLLRLCGALAPALASIFLLCPEPARAQGTWSGVAAMSTPRQIPMGGVINGKLYVAGGYNGSAYVTSGEVYDPANNSWAPIAPMPTPRGGAAEGVIDGKLYVAGGYAFPSPGYQTTTIVYDPATNQWTPKAPPPVSRGDAATVVHGGKLYVICGNVNSGGSNRVDIYDPATDTWSAGAPAPASRIFPAAAVLNGKIYVAGGLTNATTNTVSVYDPATNTWAAGPSMGTAREAPELQNINGRLFAVGGRNGGGYLNTAEAYDPAINQWQPLGTMSVPRSFFASGVVGNRLFVAGGYSGTGNLNTAEALTPPVFTGDVLISEFRLRSANDADNFVELYNNTDYPITINYGTSTTAPWDDGLFIVYTRASGSSGAYFSVVPNGTVIPARGHFLAANNGYTLSAYAARNSSEVPTSDLNSAMELGRKSDFNGFDIALDRAGFDIIPANQQSGACEGTCIPTHDAAVAAGTQFSYVRRLHQNRPQDTNNNAADFVRVSTTGAVGSSPAVLGAPGPENLASPVERNARMPMTMLDPAQPASASPNRVRDASATTGPCSTLGTLSMRRTVTNTTGAPITRLRFRVIDITAGPAPTGTADIRPITSAPLSVSVGGVMRSVQGTTLETAGGLYPSCGGLNSSLLASTVTSAPDVVDGQPAEVSAEAGDGEWQTVETGAPVASGQSVDVHFLFGVMQGGSFRVFINIEVLP